MFKALSDNWWVVALRGIAAILFGITAIVWPDITLGSLIAVFGAFAIVDGTFSMASSFSSSTRDRVWHLFGGVGAIGVGILTWIWPGLTALALLYMIATWALIVGFTEIASAITLRREIKGEWLMVLGGIISIAFGFVLIAFPGDGAIAVVTTIGFFSMLYGGSLLGLAWQLRGLGSEKTVSGPKISALSH